MANEADFAHSGNPHTSGYLVSAAPGVLEGDITFPVRGVLQFRMERRPDTRFGQSAKLICLAPYSDADLVLAQEIDAPDFWHGFIRVEGYDYRVRAERDGKRMALAFFDTAQPHWAPETLAALAEARTCTR